MALLDETNVPFCDLLLEKIGSTCPFLRDLRKTDFVKYFFLREICTIN